MLTHTFPATVDAFEVDKATHDVYVALPVGTGVASTSQVYKLSNENGHFKIQRIAGNGSALPSPPAQAWTWPSAIATDTALGIVAGITLHNGEVWLTEQTRGGTVPSLFGTLRRIDLTTGMIHTVVGSNTLFSYAKGPVIWDSNGDMLVLRKYLGLVRIHINPDNTATITSVLPKSDMWNGKDPKDMVMRSDGMLLVSLFNVFAIVEVNATTGAVATLVGPGGGSTFQSYQNNVTTTTLKSVSTPYNGGVAFDAAGSFIFADSWNCAIRRARPGIDKNGNQGLVMNTIAGRANEVAPLCNFTGDGGLALDARLNRPTFLRVTTDASIYTYDSLNKRIRKMTCVEWP